MGGVGENEFQMLSKNYSAMDYLFNYAINYLPPTK